MHPFLIAKNITKGKLKPLYLFSGEEEFLISETVHKIVSKIKGQKSGAEFISLDAREANISRILASVRAGSLFNQQKILWVKNSDPLLSAEDEEFLSYCRKPIPSTCLILTAPKLKIKSKLIKAIGAQGEIAEFKRLKEGETISWVREKLKIRGYQIDLSAAKYLLELCGTNLRRINNELEKLITFLPEQKMIQTEQIDSLTGRSSAGNIFKLTEAIGGKDLNRALKNLDKLLSGNEHPLIILTMIVRQLRILLLILALKKRGASAPEILKKTGLHNPYFLSKYLKQAENFSLLESENNLFLCLEIDKALKTGSSLLKARIILEELVIKLCRDKIDSDNC